MVTARREFRCRLLLGGGPRRYAPRFARAVIALCALRFVAAPLIAQSQTASTAPPTRPNYATAALEDPMLYISSDGVAKAARMGEELESAKQELDRALERWTLATEAMEAMTER